MYLARTQKIDIRGNTSELISVNAGIAQGTVLGLLLFIFYMNDIVASITHCKLTMFADDCVLYKSGNSWNNIHTQLQFDLNNVMSWCENNGLAQNLTKTKSMIISTPSKLKLIQNPVNLSYGGEVIQFVKKYDYLGTILDTEMTLYKNVVKNVSNKIFMLRKIRKYIDNHTAMCIYKQTILPILDYSGFLLISMTKAQKNELQTMQNDVLRFAKNVRLVDRISRKDLHKEANLLSLEQRREKQLYSLMYKLAEKGKVRYQIELPETN